MKRRDLIRILKQDGWRMIRHGSNHDVYAKETKTEPIERHNEIPEGLARRILKRTGLNKNKKSLF
ncbi:type II toxin-antitoxin system HicA family toxin [Pediococcus ethanolidurans]|uniref:type II toxin-antitoxin system HicA family toxin n=1 Tax=Pediococcus ethanolidurans TaxID=319653 RepID=UPI001C1EE806|nr:type II toxin-antitoxin system HicA family toxin [Pediococcus ethanolidurans]MBU7555158.1 type II toxin-antitoxin system HicA family toxin [Pediococcus ethanolidurans]MBU7564370.1 type II toxin-antitoxin system HicA family toxin [Pediococcus ethanolidurans]MCV3322381.1 type II toxin-antitoxin system HicA family toxin [Pediococcus ethanolidurans]MCV3324443.1 type II toxin-antitoxin system HicA family toxin [Pediococcus ethanolidurans]MCV3328179.1 type II toxin-antitoxin system HicA family to